MNAEGFLGKYKAKVVKNDDPDKKGRICVRVPDVYGEETTGWALPSSQYSGRNRGSFFIPPEGANVWVEFQQGNPDYPIWTGCFWGEDELDKDRAIPSIKMIKTDFATLTIVDGPSGSEKISIKTDNRIEIVMDRNTIQLINGNSNVTIGSQSVSINGSLVVRSL